MVDFRRPGHICFLNHKNLFNTMSTTITIMGKYYHHYDSLPTITTVNYHTIALPYAIATTSHTIILMYLHSTVGFDANSSLCDVIS